MASMSNRVIPTKGYSGPKVGMTNRIPKTLLAKIDEVAAQTGNSRAETVLYALQWAMQEYDRDREKQLRELDSRDPDHRSPPGK